MAEFIFDIQRFDDGDGGDTGSDTSNTGDTTAGSDTSTESATAGTSGSSGSSSSGSSSSSSSGSGGTSGTSVGSGGGGPATGSGGHDSGGYYTYSQWNTIYDNAMDNYNAAVELGTVNYLFGTYGIADNFSLSRYAINEIFNVDQFDTITYVDANSWDFVAYSYGNEYDDDYNVIGRDLAIALNLTSDVDSGAGSLTRIHYSDAYASGSDYFSPTITFANESLLYSNTTGWTTPEQVAFSEYFWSTCLGQSGTTDFPDVISASRGVNNYITNVDSYDTILLADTKLFDDLHSADYVGNGVALTFNNGTAAFIEYSGTFSPTIVLGSGESFVYNSRMGAWRTPAEAAADYLAYDAAATVEALTTDYLYGSDADQFSVNRLRNTFIYYTQDSDRLIFTDGTTAANITSAEAEGDYITLTFDTGTTMTVEYLNIFSPTFELADGQSFGYEWYREFWGKATRLYDNNFSDTVTLSIAANNLVYDAESVDNIFFADTDASHVTGTSDNGYYLRIDFDSGTTTSIKYNDYAAPVISYGTSAGSSGSGSSGSSADLWGDTFTGTAAADNLFVGTYANTIVQNVDAQDSVTFDAALSDIVATSVEGNTIAVAFTSGTTAVIQTAGDSPTFNLASGESFIYDRQAVSWKSA